MAEGDGVVQQNAASAASAGGENNDDVEAIRAERDELRGANASMRGEIDDIKATILSAQRQPAVQPQAQPAQSTMPTADELETMSRAELMRVVGQVVDGKIKQSVSPRIDNVDQKLVEDRMARGVADAASKYKDFPNHQRQMRLILARIARDGGVSPTDLYKLATWKEQVAATQTTSSKGTEKPTSSQSAPVSDANLSREERASKIFDKVMEKKGK